MKSILKSKSAFLLVLASLLLSATNCVLPEKGIFINATSTPIVVILRYHHESETDSFVVSPGETRKKIVSTVVAAEVVLTNKLFVIAKPLEAEQFRDNTYSKYRDGSRMQFLIAEEGVYVVPCKFWRTWASRLPEILVPENRLQIEIVERAPESKP